MSPDIVDPIGYEYAAFAFVFRGVHRLMVYQSGAGGVIGGAERADERTVVIDWCLHGVLRCLPQLSLESFYTIFIYRLEDKMSLRRVVSRTGRVILVLSFSIRDVMMMSLVMS